MKQIGFLPRIVGLMLGGVWAVTAAWIAATMAVSGAAAPIVLASWMAGAAVAAGAAAVAPHRDAGKRRWHAPAGIVALLLAASLSALLVGSATVAGTRLVGISPSVAYGAGLAVSVTAAFAAWRWMIRRSSAVTAAAAAVVGLVVMLTLTVVGPPATAAGCGAPALARSARVEIVAQAMVDGRPVGRAVQSGRRNAAGVAWVGEAAGEPIDALRVEYARVGDRAWARAGSADWTELDATSGPGLHQSALDATLAAQLRSLAGPAVEDLGVDIVGGTTARHCRTLVDGTAALHAFPPLSWLVGNHPSEAPRALDAWRGDVDWWTDAGGELIAAEIRVGGLPTDAWITRGLRGELRATLHASERNLPQPIEEPLP